MPAEFVGADAAETVNKLFPAFTAANTRAEGLRADLAKRPSAPGKAEDYTFNFNEKIAPYFPDPANNKAMGFARQAFHKHGLSPQQAQGIIDDIYGPMAEGGFLQPAFNPQNEVKAFAQHHQLDDAGAASALAETESFSKGLLGQLNIPAELREGAQAELAALTDTAGGNALLRALSKRLADSGIRVPNESSGGQGGPLSDADVDKLTADPRIDPRNNNHQDAAKRYDPELRKRYDAAMAERGRKRHGPAR